MPRMPKGAPAPRGFAQRAEEAVIRWPWERAVERAEADLLRAEQALDHAVYRAVASEASNHAIASAIRATIAKPEPFQPGESWLVCAWCKEDGPFAAITPARRYVRRDGKCVEIQTGNTVICMRCGEVSCMDDAGNFKPHSNSVPLGARIGAGKPAQTAAPAGLTPDPNDDERGGPVRMRTKPRV